MPHDILYTTIQTARLKSIEKHSEALAEELSEIDDLICPRCTDSVMDDVSYFHGEELMVHRVECTHCGYRSW